MSNCYAIYEVTPGPEGDVKRMVIIRDTKEDCMLILEALEMTNLNFDLYVIKEHSYDTR